MSSFLILTFHFNIAMRFIRINVLSETYNKLSNYSELKRIIYRFLIEIFFYIDFNILGMKKIKND